MLDLDPVILGVGLLVGWIVGLTGMGGGALMTPLLVLFLGVPPTAAVASDLTASLFMKPLGAAVHARRGTVDRGLVRLLMTGSVPAAFCAACAVHLLGDAAQVEKMLRPALGGALLLAAGAMVFKAWLRSHASDADDAPLVLRPGATVAIGVAGGLVVGVTSVGSGSLMMVMLMLLYPALGASRLVGTDLAQAVPLVGAAALGHLLFGAVDIPLTAALLVGALPGVYVGARLSAVAPDHLIRPVLVAALCASSLKLLQLPTGVVVAVALAGAASLATQGVLRGRRPAPVARL